MLKTVGGQESLEGLPSLEGWESLEGLPPLEGQESLEGLLSFQQRNFSYVF